MLGTIVLALAAGATTTAQSGSAPAVRVLRDFRLDEKVWPADLNRDGVTDLISSSPTTFSGGSASGGHLQVSTGRGDGTFNAPVQSSFRGFAVGAADFNGDQKVDVIAASPAMGGPSSYFLIPGTGTATLGAPVVIAPVPDTLFAFALSADFNGDGKRDLVLPGGEGRHGLPGERRFHLWYVGGARRSKYSDRRDHRRLQRRRAPGSGDRQPVQLALDFLNQGSLMFSAADIPMPPEADGERTVTDATVADVNGDGRIDLLVSAGRAEDIFRGRGAGFVQALPGNGDGTFGTLVEYPWRRERCRSSPATSTATE